MSFLALETYVVVAIIAVVLVQYALATFCLFQLALLDISKKQYALWNVFILLVFFIGDIAFLIYWSKVKDAKRIKPFKSEELEKPEKSENAESIEQVETAEKPETEEMPAAAETDEPKEKNSTES